MFKGLNNNNYCLTQPNTPEKSNNINKVSFFTSIDKNMPLLNKRKLKLGSKLSTYIKTTAIYKVVARLNHFARFVLRL